MDRLQQVYLGRLEAIVLYGSVFALYAGASLLWSNTDLSYSSAYLAALIASFVLGYYLKTLRWIWVGYIFLVGILLALALTIGPIIGPNIFGAVAAVALAGALAYGLWPLLPIPLAALAFSQSRGAVLGASVAIILFLWERSKFLAYITFLLSTIVIVTVKNDLDASFLSRFGIWQDTINHLTVFGHGFGSFLETYRGFEVRTNMFNVLAPHAYNDFLEVVSDLGIGAVALWFLIAACMEDVGARTRLIIFTFFALSLTFFPLYIPIVGHLFALTLGHAAQTKRTVRYG